jgi:protein-disulfide isomerase
MGDDSGARLPLTLGARDHIRGASDAAITLVEYGDFECPYSGRAYPIVKAVQKHFGRRLRFVFRNFPLADIHPHAQHAAEVAEAAADQDRFWEMHDALYEHQQALDDRHLIGYAKALGLDEARVQQALRLHDKAARVREDLTGGVRSGVTGTPTFFINGRRHDDAWDLESLIEALERV